MIEVEKKFSLSADEINKLTAGSQFLGEKTFTDEYYDTEDFLLTAQDKWLRLRDGKWELKLTMNKGQAANKRKMDQYEELETEEGIKEALNIKSKKPLSSALAELGYKPFCKITTTRKKYKKGEFTIDLDQVDFGYNIGEIELMVEDHGQMQEALDKITEFAGKNNLSLLPVRGKVVEYLKRNKPEHYQKLKDAGVV
jgi:predicted adenylyl cyclase CyaB